MQHLESMTINFRIAKCANKTCAFYVCIIAVKSETIINRYIQYIASLSKIIAEGCRKCFGAHNYLASLFYLLKCTADSGLSMVPFKFKFTYVVTYLGRLCLHNMQ